MKFLVSTILVIFGAAAVSAVGDLLSDGECLSHEGPLVSANGQWRIGLNVEGKVLLLSTHTVPILIFGNPDHCSDVSVCAKSGKILISACGKEVSAQVAVAARLSDHGALELLDGSGKVSSTIVAHAWGEVKLI